MSISGTVQYTCCRSVASIGISAIVLSTISMACPAIAQIQPDESLQSERSVFVQNGGVVQGSPADLIRGGAIRDANLFHSFGEFNVNDGQRVYFAPPSGVTTILNRVTGTNPSVLLGTLGVLGNADLFLLNPNGIVFGENARLDLRGSFIATTGDRILFDNGYAFSSHNPTAPPLLTVTTPIGLQYGANSGSIITRSVEDPITNSGGLQSEQNSTLALLGGKVRIEGGILDAQTGRIELGGIGNGGLVRLAANNPGWSFNYRDIGVFQDIQLSQSARVLGNGDIGIQGRRVVITGGSQIGSLNTGTAPGGAVTVRATDALVLSGVNPVDDKPSQLYAFTQGPGRAGDVRIITRRLSVLNGAQLFSSDESFETPALPPAGAGNITIRASDWVEVASLAPNNVTPSFISTQGAVGNGGNLSVNTRRLVARDGGRLRSSTFGAGRGGQLQVNATDAVLLTGGLFSPAIQDIFQSGLFSRSEPSATGAAGRIVVNTARLQILDGAEIASTTLGTGTGGGVIVNASNTVLVSGLSLGDFYTSRITVTTQAAGAAGNLRVNTGRAILREGGQFLATTFGSGAGGTLDVRATELVEVNGFAGEYFSQLNVGSLDNPFTNEPATGVSGNLRVTTNQFRILNGAIVTVGTEGVGSGGRIRIRANDVDILRRGAGFGSLLSARTFGDRDAGTIILSAQTVNVDDGGEIAVTTRGGAGGNINLDVSGALLLRNGSSISAEALNEANGGNVNISTPAGFVIANRAGDNDILASADRGNGGNINVTTLAILGLEERNPLTGFSDINASSNFGLDGTIVVNTLGIDPSRGLTELPADVVDASNQIAQGCNPDTSVAQTRGSFVVTGRGGLPTNPADFLNSDALSSDWVELPDAERVTTAPAIAAPTPVPAIVEAQGWEITADNQVRLTNQAVTPSLLATALASRACLSERQVAH